MDDSEVALRVYIWKNVDFSIENELEVGGKTVFFFKSSDFL